MVNNILSICIPTYNRVETLKITLPDLISKIEKHKIKIYISDNNSTDATGEYVKGLATYYPYLMYNKNNQNYGPDKNMVIALRLSDTPYSLLLSDHYILYNIDSIKNILKYLNSQITFDCVVLHYKNRKMFKNDSCVYTDKNLFLEELGWYIGMAATTIYSHEMIKKFNINKFCGTNFNQSLMVLDYISSKKSIKIQYIAEDIIWNMKGGIIGQSSWHDRALEIFARDWYKGIMSLPDHYSKESKFNCIQNHGKMTVGFFSFKSMVLYKYAGGLRLGMVIRYMKYLYYCADLKTVFVALLVSLIPIVSIKYLFKNEWEYINRVLGKMDKYNKG